MDMGECRNVQERGNPFPSSGGFTGALGISLGLRAGNVT
jgi:hypothetical protein